MQTQRAGPFQIIEKISENNYTIKIKGKLKVYHANKMKRFIEREKEIIPSYNASFIDYEADDKYHEEIVERLDILTEGLPEKCEMSEYCSKDLSLRIFPDYRKLKKISIFDPEPMNTSEDIMANMNDVKNFTKSGLCKGYWQIPIQEEDRAYYSRRPF